MRPPLRFAVGDEVVWSSVNFKGTKRCVVERVGRKLVYIKGERHPYRIKDGIKSDGYGHEAIRSLAAYEYDKKRDAARLFFGQHGLSSGWTSDADWLIWAADVLRADAPEGEKEGERNG